ncbi:uncharacterized protein Dsimw501_GD29415, isoform B [Drosophila simulans]|uniref:Uncharacterized protein, isoform B n=1 Tax=Drosophila simulans TaxID=7240 RepID=A0A0J9RVF6_DROSI|nr:uncharacterized protein Dsimw501_GD29415, isoform B [Drosophila simulans]
MQIDEGGEAGSSLITEIPRSINNGPPRRARTTIDVAKTDGQYITIRSFLLIHGVVGFGEGPG